ncbi:hypothetical protein TRFO_03386 [Tritrichomonas foetus]|uniref:F5/8 type C domain-containing protein n=1 Tax=Tritrichomonas foetus TaxID=1144522 RepID=A0A1J4KQS7_9EUKA|nr:hypothetical protein TRFO_03386 [Tritrichomonas foetus]|eukprot:OHT13611.1 hypothetical protein TRFO_03386 [Tritrichomonas foetus]
MSFTFTIPSKVVLPYQKDFTIYVNTPAGPKEYKHYLVMLTIFSPKINQLVICDPTITYLNFPIYDTKNEFPLVDSLVEGGEIRIDEHNQEFLTKAAYFFENEEFLKAVSNYYIKYSPQLMFQRLHQNLPVSYYETELKYISENFEMFMEVDLVKELSITQYEVIFNLPEFSVNEDSLLFQWITSLVDNRGPEFISLYTYVYFDSLSTSEIRTFLQKVPISSISGSIWNALIPRLKKKVVKNKTNEKVSKSHQDFEDEETYRKVNKNQNTAAEYTDQVIDVPLKLQMISQNLPYMPGGHFKGIFDYLSDDGNPQYRGYITIDCSGVKKKFLNRIFYSKVEREYKWNNYNGKGFSENSQWLMVRFLIYKVKLSAYTLAVPQEKADLCQPKHWKLLGSNDGKEWNVVDERNCQDLNRARAIAVFKLNNNTFYSRFKFVQLENHCKTPKPEEKFEFSLCHVEFFGEVQKL